MARWYRLSMMALILLVVWGCGKSSSLEGQGQPLAEVKPLQLRFTKADNGVITDSVTGLDWYVGPNRDNNWHQAKAWTENLTVAGGGWRMPTVPELKALYQKGASRVNMDPLFQTQGGLGLVRADARRPDGLGLRLLQRPGELARLELRLRQNGVCGAFPKMMMGHSPEPQSVPD